MRVCIILVRCYKFVTFHTHSHCLWKLQHMNFWNQNFIFFNKLLNFHKRRNSFIFLRQNLHFFHTTQKKNYERKFLVSCNIIIIKKYKIYHFMNTLLLLFSKVHLLEMPFIYALTHFICTHTDTFILLLLAFNLLIVAFG